MKYILLNRILDKICEDAPDKYKSYKDTSDEGIIHAKSKAFIHLFLKVKFGIIDFDTREELITDGSNDGGLDAYFIDDENKDIYLIQSKFRSTEQNFEEKEIDIRELLKMETSRIIKGERQDSNGITFNNKVLSFQSKLSDISDIARYDYKVIILANLKKYNNEQIKKLIDKLPYTIFDYERSYNELVYPMCTSTYYDNQKVEVAINLDDKVNRLSEEIDTSYGNCNVSIIFVPIKEVGRVMSKYKNSILKYNPRNYLSLSKNKVNQKIKDSILKNEFGDFAILNNGITILCDDLKATDQTGKKNKSQVLITNPQFINGGQTAYTLSKIIKLDPDNENILNKKVMLKIITIEKDDSRKEAYIKFIEKISDATNMQSKVEEADRRSNESIQIKLQKYIYSKYSLLYERKKGEFETAISEGYLNKEYIIDRSDFLRASLAYKGHADKARANSGDKLFQKEMFNSILSSKEEFDDLFIAYSIFNKLVELERKSKKEKNKCFGEALRYGKYAVVMMVGKILRFNNIHEYTNNEDYINGEISKVLELWQDFEKVAISNNKNSKFFENESREFLSYYKSPNLIDDINEYYENNFAK